MLSKHLADPGGIEGPPGGSPGLGFLDVITTLESSKMLAPVAGRDAISGAAVRGYEMHLGRTIGPDCERPMLALDGGDGGAGSADGRALGCYLHGLFAADAYRHAFLNRLRLRADSGLDFDNSIDAALDTLADHLEQHLDIAAILQIAASRQ